MRSTKPRVMLGPMFTDPSESVSAVNRSFVAGLAQRYDFILPPSPAPRGSTCQALHMCQQIISATFQVLFWLWNLLRHRPHIAHYAVSSGWAMEKGLILLLLARCFGARTIGHLHSGGFLTHWHNLPRWRRAIAQWQLLRLDCFIVLSEWWRGRILENIGFPSSRVWVVNNPIDPEFEAQALSYPAQRKEPRILSMGIMGRDKGVFDLLEASAIVKRAGHRFHLNLVGPEREPGIRKEIEEKISNVSCLDFVSISGPIFGSEKMRLFRDCPIFILPSYYENFPLVVIEAAAAGQAIIATPVGAIPEFLKDNVSALFVPTHDAAALADAMMRLLDHPDERLRLGQAARTAFQTQLARKRILEDMASAYGRILAPAPDPDTESSRASHTCKQIIL